MKTKAKEFSPEEAEKSTRYLYWWLLLALFFEYGRPAAYFKPLGLLPLNSAIPLVLFLVTCFAKGLRPWNRIFADGLAKWPFIFLGAVLASMLWATVGGYSFIVFQKMLGYLFIYIMIVRICTSRERVNGVALTLIVSHLFLLVMNPEVVLSPTTRHYVIGATFLGDGNDYSMSMCILLGFQLNIALNQTTKFKKMFSWFLLGLLMLTIIGTQSRGATLGMVGVFGYMWWRSPRKAAGVVAIVVAVIGVLLYAPAVYFERMGTLSAPQEDSSAEGRIHAWRAGTKMALHNPLGVGAGNFPNNFPKYRGPDAPVRWMTAHSMYFLILGELGILGLLMLFKLVFGNFRSNVRLRKRLEEEQERLKEPTRFAADIRALNAYNGSIIGLAIAGGFLSVTYYPHIFVMVGVCVALRRVMAEEAGLVDAPAAARKRAGTRRLRPGAEQIPAT
ncbi:O-antigen ligase family protein [Steroidobacter flavus]|uniref:O-antigen ligase family protein n=1 Tax=Steroidobacter flavus TaxID=1842136 RepID=A0ABV8T332_9GAMM